MAVTPSGEKQLRELDHCASSPSELINGEWNKESIHFCSSSAPASRWGGWNSHSGCTLTCTLVSCHREGKQEVGGCLRPLVTDKTPLPDLTAEAHWLIDVLRDFKSSTLTPVVIISNVHSGHAWIFQNGVISHTETWCQSQLTGKCLHSSLSSVVTPLARECFVFPEGTLSTRLSHTHLTDWNTLWPNSSDQHKPSAIY